ncbi:MAG TPA: ABC transporter permease [Myxococcaceae bacterium]|nr:ABC transporter permease [Myxococcaceae bacterium]
MARYALRRLLLVVPTLIGITILTFAVLKLAPGDPLGVAVGAVEPGAGGRDAIEALRRVRGLDRPVWEQYARWVGRVATLDFGRSLQDGRPVIAKIAEALPRTLLLSSLALLVSFLLAIPAGAFAATRRNALADRLIGFASFALYSMPAFWIAVLLLLYLATDRGVPWFPLQGLTSTGFESFGLVRKILDLAWHLVLPVLVLACASFAVVSRTLRSGMIDVLRQDFIRTARAKGLPERAVIYHHALRNALLPIVTLLGLMLPYLVGGSVIVEQIFGIPGMGLLAFEAIRARDDAMVMGLTTLVALLTLASTWLSDLLYALVDPRVQLEARR